MVQSVLDYCSCELPIRTYMKPETGYKIPYCHACHKQVNPRSKAIDKSMEKLDLRAPTRNEKVLQDKINELIDLVRANGGMSG